MTISIKDSLEKINPELAKQWNVEKNHPLSPSEILPNSNKKVWWTCKENPKHVWQATVQSRNSGKGCGLCRGLVIQFGINDLQTLHPAIAAEWDSKRNESLNPKSVSPTSSQKVWWICPIGHSYRVAIDARAKGTKCQVCANRIILAGFNDLSTKFPEIAREFASDLNAGVLPTEIGSGSGSKFWWRCELGHVWEAKITNRTALGSGCPICKGKKINVGSTDFGSINSKVKNEWSKERNLGLDPSLLGKSSSKKVWWDCEKGHSWQATVADRMKGQGCAVCANRQVITGINDLATTHPHLVDEIDTSRIPGNLAETIPAGTPMKIWWRCSKGHEWFAAVSMRSLKGQNCPYCSGNLVITGTNDLESLNPDLAQEWHFLKNNVQPSQVKAGSMKRVWWICKRGHEWQAAVRSRSIGTGCPFCSNLKVLDGFNDLQTTYPEIAKSWDFDRNTVKPTEVVAGTHVKYWWKCPKHHSWQASPNKRIQGRNCPTCAPSGFVPGKPGILYFLEHRDWSSFKIGITNTEGNRLKSLYKDGWVPLQLTTFDYGADAEIIESECLRWIRTELHLPPYLNSGLMTRTGGWTETFSSELVSEKTVKDYIETQIKHFGKTRVNTET